jgi:hypothetical protein
MAGIASMTILGKSAYAQEPVVIKFHVKVAGYSNRWIRVDEGCKSGGKVLQRNGEYVTDRVMRGEQVQISIDDKSFTRKCHCSFLLEAKVIKNNKTVFKENIEIPFKREYTLPDDPQFRNVVIEVADDIAKGGKVSRRLPIGKR